MTTGLSTEGLLGGRSGRPARTSPFRRPPTSGRAARTTVRGPSAARCWDPT